MNVLNERGALTYWLSALVNNRVVVRVDLEPMQCGQELIVELLDKVRELRSVLAAAGREIAIEVDGGVKAGNARQCVEAGANLLVAGSAVYNERETPQQALATLRSAIETNEQVASERRG